MRDETVHDLLTGYVSPMERSRLQHFCPSSYWTVATMLRDLKYFQQVVIPIFLNKLTWEYPDNRVREQAQAILLDIASRLDPNGTYLEKRKQYRKTFHVPDMYHHCQDITRTWLTSKHSLGVRLLTAAYYRQFSPEARRFVARKLALTADKIGTKENNNEK